MLCKLLYCCVNTVLLIHLSPSFYSFLCLFSFSVFVALFLTHNRRFFLLFCLLCVVYLSPYLYLILCSATLPSQIVYILFFIYFQFIPCSFPFSSPFPFLSFAISMIYYRISDSSFLPYQFRPQQLSSPLQPSLHISAILLCVIPSVQLPSCAALVSSGLGASRLQSRMVWVEYLGN